MPLTVSVEVPPRDREVLASWVRSPSIRAGLAQRARIVLLAAGGAGTNEIVRRTGVSKPTVIAWKRRYAAGGVGGLEDRPKPGKPRTTDDVAIVLRTLEPPPRRLGVTHWSSRLLAAELGLSNVKVARACPRRKLHIVCDNYGTHSHPDVRAWLATHPRIILHFTPTPGSWLNMVEIFFSIITRQAIRRGSFTSVKDLIAAIEAFTGGWNDRCHPFTWTKPADELLPHCLPGKRSSFTRH